jgi:sulfofructose kinase
LLSSWGVACGLATTLGDDEYGRKIMAEFRAVGTDLSLTEIRPGHRTPVSVILVNLENGSRTLVNWKAQKSNLGLNPALLGGLSPRVLLLDGHELDASRAALHEFPDAISILDAGSLHAGTAALAGQVQYLVASEKFARQVTQLAALGTLELQTTCWHKLKERYQNQLVITFGEQGLIAEDAGACRVLPAFKVAPVDTTGAGDIFHGAFAYAMWQQMDLWPGLKFASMTAALSVQKRGGRPSIPALAEVRKALAHAH